MLHPPQAAAQGPAAQPFDMFGGGGGQGGAAAGPLDFLRNNPQFQLLRTAVQSNPQILIPMLQVGASGAMVGGHTCGWGWLVATAVVGMSWPLASTWFMDLW